MGYGLIILPFPKFVMKGLKEEGVGEGWIEFDLPATSKINLKQLLRYTL